MTDINRVLAWKDVGKSDYEIILMLLDTIYKLRQDLADMHVVYDSEVE